jgi:hypothetical protein
VDYTAPIYKLVLTMNNSPKILTSVQKRQTEAEIVDLIYKEMILTIGEDAARKILSHAITKISVSEGVEQAKMADSAPTPKRYMELMQDWSRDGSMDITPISNSEQHAHFKVTRCAYAEMYKSLGKEPLGEILSCGRDGTVCQGYNANLQLSRTQTIMTGASSCDFRIELLSSD